MHRGSRAAAVLLLLVASVLSTAPGARARAPGASTAVLLRLLDDGALQVTETHDVPAGTELEHRTPLRVEVGDDLVRVYQVRDVTTTGSASASVDDDTFVVRTGPGTSTVGYTVDGALAAGAGSAELRWTVAGVSDTARGSVDVVVETRQAPTSVSCLAGPPGSSGACTLSSSGGETPGTTLRQSALAAGDRFEVVLVLPPDVAPATATVVETFSLGRAFRPGAASLGLGGVVLVALLGAAGALARLRGRDAAAAGVPAAPVVPLTGGGGGGSTTFASPDGVLPGQVGVVVDEHVDAVDVAATVLDLCVRRHLQVEAVDAPTGPTWTLHDLGQPADPLRPYERAVLELVAGRTLPALSDLGPDELDRVAGLLHAEVVELGWFARRPDTDRSRWTRTGLAVVVAGALLTVLLAATTTLALVGLAVLLGGAALLVVAPSVPARTTAGATLVSELSGLRRWLRAADVSGVPAADREVVLSRSLPFALVLGELEPWLVEMSRVDHGTDGTPGWYWLDLRDPSGEPLHSADRVAAVTHALCRELEGVLASAGHLRRLR